MAQSVMPQSIEALIEGSVSGQVAVGNHNVQVVAAAGAVVQIASPDRQATPRLRPTPVALRPRVMRGLLDRQEPLGAMAAALAAGLPVELHGPAGIGKSALLRTVAYGAESGQLPDGVVYLHGLRQPRADLLQLLFDAFYECEVPYKATDTESRQLLAARRALVLLDDAELEREEVESLLDAAPACTFVLAASERRLWGESRAVALGGLPPADALALFERELGRALAPAEREAAASFCAAVLGHPLRILQGAAAAREEHRPVAELAAARQPDDEATRALAALSEPQRELVGALAALGPNPVGVEHLAGLTAIPGAAGLLDDLLQRRLVVAHSPRYSLAGDLPATARPAAEDLSRWRARALEHYVRWTEDGRPAPAAVVAEAGVLQQLVAWAVTAGRAREAIALGRALETALLLAGRWSAWAAVLEAMLGAARALGDKAAEALSLHQLGTRALCLGDAAAARANLTRALELRESLHDELGAAVTRHNLGLLAAPPPGSPDRTPPRPRGWLPWVVLPILLVLGGAVAMWRTILPDIVKWGTTGTAPGHPQRIEAQAPATAPKPPGPPAGPSQPPAPQAPPQPPAPPAQASEPQPGTPQPPAPPEPPAPPAPGGEPPPFQQQPPVVEPPQPPPSPPVPEPPSPPILPSPPSPPVLLVPEMALSPRRLDFGGLQLGAASGPRQATAANVGSIPFAVGAIRISGPARSDFQVSEACRGNTLRAGQRCPLEIVFTPKAPGDRIAVLEAAGPNGTRAMALRGRGISPSTTPQGWCCRDGKAFAAAAPADCKEQGGAFFPQEEEARLACTATAGGCCVNGQFLAGVSRGPCDRQQGVFMSLEESLIGCRQVPPGWCCAGGDVFQGTAAQCTQRNGQVFASETAARRVCKPTGTASGGCCLDGRLVAGLPQADCAKRNGTFMPRAASSEACQPVGQPGTGEWCCAGGNVFQGSRRQCMLRDGKVFTSEVEARRACRPAGTAPGPSRDPRINTLPGTNTGPGSKSAPGTGCCLAGTFVAGVVQADCVQRRGTFMLESAAARMCSARVQPQGFCCAGGQLFTSGAEQCQARGGRFYGSAAEARRGCAAKRR